MLAKIFIIVFSLQQNTEKHSTKPGLSGRSSIITFLKSDSQKPLISVSGSKVSAGIMLGIKNCRALVSDC